MLNLAFEVWNCSVPTEVSGSARLSVDPSITCTIDYFTKPVGDYFTLWLVGAGLMALLSRCPTKCFTNATTLFIPNATACIGFILFIVGAVGLIATSVWGGLLVGSVIAFLFFGIAFPALSLSILNRGAAEGRLDEDEFQVQSEIGVLLLLLLLFIKSLLRFSPSALFFKVKYGALYMVRRQTERCHHSSLVRFDSI